jgi:hypothetical protein
MLMKEVAWVTSQAYSDDHQEVLDLLASGKLELESLITARIPLRNVVEDGIMALLDKKEDHIKVIWPVGSRSRLSVALDPGHTQHGLIVSLPWNLRRSSALHL